MDFNYYQHTSTHTAEITQWLHVANQCITAEEQRYCYVRILELDEGNITARQGLAMLGNGPATAPRHVHADAPILIMEPLKPKRYLVNDEKPDDLVIAINERSVRLIAFTIIIVCITVVVLQYLK